MQKSFKRSWAELEEVCIVEQITFCSSGFQKNLFLSPGMAFASTRILQACPKHNKNRHILYVDANNLYGEFSKF